MSTATQQRDNEAGKHTKKLSYGGIRWRIWYTVAHVNNLRRRLAEGRCTVRQAIQKAAEGPDVGWGADYATRIQVDHLWGAARQRSDALELLQHIRLCGSRRRYALRRSAPKITHAPRVSGKKNILQLHCR